VGDKGDHSEWFRVLLREFGGGAVVPRCAKCGRQRAHKGLQLTRSECVLNGYCVCGGRELPPLTDTMELWMVWQMLHMVPGTYCGDPNCEECGRK
jgi:recombinational DNA repair protein (RecF pathway)